MDILKREKTGKTEVIALQIPSIERANALLVARAVSDAIPTDGAVVIDLSELRYFDVPGFAVILSWVAEDRQRADVRLCSRSGSVRALFELLRAETLVQLFRSREDARASFPRSEHDGEDLERAFVPDQRIA
jgi:anti-anti-sigma regulatory factor